MQTDWRDFLGDKTYQRAYLDFYEDTLALRYAYDWKKVVEEFMFHGKEPLIHGLVAGRKFPPPPPGLNRLLCAASQPAC